jgi:hypothetical protein
MDREGKTLNSAVSQIVIAVIIATIMSGFGTYVAINSKIALLEYKLDEYMSETRKLRADVSNLQLQRLKHNQENN